MEVSSNSMNVASVTVRAMIQGLMAGRAALGAGFVGIAGSGGGGGAIFAGSVSVAVAISMGIPSESLRTVSQTGRVSLLKKRPISLFKHLIPWSHRSMLFLL